MTTGQIAASAIAAVLLFWAVGAHNRLVRLRNEIVQRFGPVQTQFGLRHALLLQQLDALAPVLVSAAPRLEALRAACQQAEAACAHARARPGTIGATTSLRLAEDILSDARARLPATPVPSTDGPDLAAQLVQTDSALAFARGQFNAAVITYNDAVRQFPTWLIAAVFSFRPAGTL